MPVPYRIAYTQRSLEDLKVITAWSEEHYSDLTEEFLRGLYSRIDGLRLTPEMGVAWRKRAQTRRLLYAELFWIYYEVDRDQRKVNVLAIRHVSRRAPKL
jgi:plasmid stabilization system protein ParE